jgi:Zn-dependent M28 family amino/carboxypeptidase
MDDELATITGDTFGRHIAELTALGGRHPAQPGSVATTQAYLTEAAASAGLTAVVEGYGTEHHDANLLVELPGAREGWYELAAHWDTVPGSPGADDNASGVAGVLEAMRVLAGFRRPGYGIRCCFFGGEETGFLGSDAHVRRTAATEGTIVLEMIGYRSTAARSQLAPAELHGLLDLPSAGTFIGLVTDANSAGLLAAVQQAVSRYTPDLETVGLQVPPPLVDVVSRSDHVPYWYRQRRALLVTDTADYRNPHYHLPSDTLATLDLAFAAEVTRAVTAAVATLAGAVPRR